MSTIDQAQIKENPPTKDRRPNHWATSPSTLVNHAMMLRWIDLSFAEKDLRRVGRGTWEWEWSRRGRLVRHGCLVLGRRAGWSGVRGPPSQMLKVKRLYPVNRGSIWEGVKRREKGLMFPLIFFSVRGEVFHAWTPEFFSQMSPRTTTKSVSYDTRLMSLDLHAVSTLQTKVSSLAAWFQSSVYHTYAGVKLGRIPPDLRSGTSYLRSATSNLGSATAKWRSSTLIILGIHRR